MTEVRTKVSLDIGQLQRSLETFVGTNKELYDAIKQVNEEYGTHEDRQKQIARGRKRATQDLRRDWDLSHKQIKDKIVDLDEAWAKLTTKLKQTRLIGPAAEALPQQLTGARNAFQQFRNTMLSELPFGGVIGLMVLGGKREEEIRSMTTSAMRTFQQAGQVGAKQLTQLSGRIRNLGVQLGKGPTGLMGEFAAAGSAFAQFGVDTEKVLKQSFMGPLVGTRETILETSVRLDSLFKQAAGTSARQMGQLIKDFNVSAEDSAEIIAKIGLAARDSGSSVGAFTDSVMRSAAALRTQRVDIEEVADAQLKFQKAMQRDLGAKPEYAAGYAERAISQVTQGLAGMSVGLSAVVGERILARRPELATEEEPVTGLAARRALRLGFRGAELPEEQIGVFRESIAELITMAKEAAPTGAEQEFFLEKMGFGFEGAQALMSIAEDMDKGTSLSDAINKNQKNLRKAFIDRGKEQSGYLKAIMDAQDGLAKIAAGLLTSVISGFQGLISGIQAIWEQYVSGDERKAAYRMYQMEASGKGATRGFDYMYQGLQQLGEGAREFRETLMGRHGARLKSYAKWQEEEGTSFEARARREGTLGQQLLGYATQYMPGAPSSKAMREIEIPMAEKAKIAKEDISRGRAREKAGVGAVAEWKSKQKQMVEGDTYEVNTVIKKTSSIHKGIPEQG